MSTMTAPSASLGQEPIGDRASNVLHYIRHPLQAVGGRLEQGRVQLQLARVELTEILALTLAALVPLFEEKKQSLEFNPPSTHYWAPILKTFWRTVRLIAPRLLSQFTVSEKRSRRCGSAS